MNELENDIFTLTEEQAHRLMAERTKKLALVQVERATSQTLEIATFNLGTERYAIESVHIREIAAFNGLTRVPGTPDFIAGVINLHGQIVALIDLRKLFGIASGALLEGSKVIVLGKDRIEFAIIVDSVDRIVKVNQTDLQDSQDIVTGTAGEYVLGVTIDALIVLDGRALLEDKRLFVNQMTDLH